MNSLLLFLFLGASVALAELPFEHPDFVEFLNEESHEEILGELNDEENDPHHDHHHHHHPSGTPPVLVKECKFKLGECIKNANDEPCARFKCLEEFGKCIKENLPSPHPTLPFTISPKKKECLSLQNECYENAVDCKQKIRCIICTKFCLHKRGRRLPRFCRPRPSGLPSFPFTRPSRRPFTRPSGGPTRPRE